MQCISVSWTAFIMIIIDFSGQLSLCTLLVWMRMAQYWICTLHPGYVHSKNESKHLHHCCLQFLYQAPKSTTACYNFFPRQTGEGYNFFPGSEMPGAIFFQVDHYISTPVWSEFFLSQLRFARINLVLTDQIDTGELSWTHSRGWKSGARFSQRLVSTQQRTISRQ